MADSKEKNKKEKSKGIKRFLIIFWSLILIGLFSFFVLIFSVAQGAFGKLPSFEELENPKSNLATEVYSADGKLLGKYFKENRSNVHYNDLSPNLVDALIATEDVRFRTHSGVDERSLVRVIIKSLILQQSESGGGSTISQQLAKNLFHDRPTTKWERGKQKLKEWIIATRLERRYTKEEILTMYLNTVEFVNNAHGIKSAATVYFNTSPDSLNIVQSALLVGMVKNPSLYNPVRFPERALERRNVVLNQMLKYNYITRADYDSLKNSTLQLDYQPVDHNVGLAPYFRENLRLYLQDWAKKNPKIDGTTWDIYRDGLKVYTTLDSRMQEYAEEAVAEHLSKLQGQFYDHWNAVKVDPWTWKGTERYNPDFLKTAMKRSERYRQLKREEISEDSINKIFNTPVEMKVFAWKDGKGIEKDTLLSPLDSIRYYKYFLQAGFMVADPYTGEVLAYVGGVNHKHFQVDHVRTKRQVGSTFKPFIYTIAIMELGYSPCQQLMNSDIVFDKFQNWSPKNSGKYKEGQMIELRDALAHSVNKITARLMYNIGQEIAPKKVIDIIRLMGITSPIPPVPSISLGTADISVYEMVSAYTTFVNHGVHSNPMMITRIEDKYGNVIAKFSPEQNEAFSDETAYVMLQFLKDVVNMGTGNRLRRAPYNFDNEIAGKTGTTQENTDGWFMGVVPELVAGVWVGGDDPVISFRSTYLGQGASMALPIYGNFLKKVYADKSLRIEKDVTFPAPVEPLSIELDCNKYNYQNKNDDYDELKPGSSLIY